MALETEVSSLQRVFHLLHDLFFVIFLKFKYEDERRFK